MHGLPAVVGETARVGLFGGEDPQPALCIDPGDEVVTSVLGPWAGRLARNASMADLLRLRAEYPGVGPHTLTGPIEVTGARPGDAIGVEILAVVPEDHGVNFALPADLSRGVLAERLAEGYVRHFDIDAEAGIARSGALEVPIAPFLGFVGVAPADPEPRSSVVPGAFGGNIDLRLATAGATVWLPVHRPGALLYLGDAHAAQGNGEISGTAIECGARRVHIRVHRLEGVELEHPRLTDAESLVSVGLGGTLEDAVRVAAREMLSWLSAGGMDEADAYALCSVAGNISVTQVVNRTVGAHLTIPRSLVRGEPSPPALG